MNVEHEKLTSKKSNKTSLINETKLNPRKQQLISKIMKKYTVSEKIANDVVNQLENNDKVKKISNNKDTQKNIDDSKNSKQKSKEQTNSQTSLNKRNNPKTKVVESNVDGIISNLIPNYEKQVSIELKNVDLTFEVDNEKIDTLKEKFITTLKRTKIKKMKIHALKDISFTITQGEKIGLIGYNGAGKSTLLRVITGIYEPDNGTVKTHGRISPLLSLGAGFDHNFSGRINILLNGAILGYSKEFLEEKIDEIIEFSELGEYIDIPIKNYSSGMMAKLGFSIATIVQPDILIIDEILGVGDATFKKKSSDKMKSLMESGTTVILVSHSIPQIREICDKAIWLDEGKIREIGDVNEVCNHYLKDAEKASIEQLKNIKLSS